MAEIIDDKKVFSLFEVSRSVQKTLSERYQSSFWVKAEMNKLNYYSHSGHCYPELVEKKDGKIIAQTKSTLWKKDYQRINRSFLQTLNEPLKEGNKILFLAKVSFDALYGFTLQILDIDPGFTLGDLEREKKETLQQLQKEKIFSANRNLPFPLLPQRIAVISVESSKGYADFKKILIENNWNYKFFHFLFPSLLQGDRAAQNMLRQLRQIERVKEHFDVVVIIRGGGGDIGLSCYNNYELAREICLFPIPVLTGIGHATNETIAEMVSHYNAITPTKLAEFLIQKFHNFSVPLRDAKRRISEAANRKLQHRRTELETETKFLQGHSQRLLALSGQKLEFLTINLSSQSQAVVRAERTNLTSVHSLTWSTSLFKLAGAREKLHASTSYLEKSTFSITEGHRSIQAETVKRLNNSSKQFLELHRRDLEFLQKNVSLIDPANVLKRGFSITRFDGNVVKNASEIPSEAKIETELFNGIIESIVTKK